VTDYFEDHCWQGVVPADIIAIYADYKRETFVGPKPALLAVDLYECVYQGGPVPVAEGMKTHPSSCGVFAYDAIEPTQRLFAAARKAGLPVVYSTSDTRPNSQPQSISATKRKRRIDPAMYKIRSEFEPQANDVIITKQRASVFFATPLAVHLTQLGVRSLIICGESTSGCVRATAVDAYSAGFHVVLVEECCFDRSPLSHAVNLFDMHHKYCDVMHIDEVVRHLDSVTLRNAD
jgi:nicotinamidase-related amidase